MSALNKKSFLTYLKEGGIYVVLLVLLAIIIFQDPTFLSLLNLSNILTQSSVRIIIALGVAGLIVTQGTDLSAGRQVGLAAVVAATLLQSMDNANKVFPEMATMPIALVILIVSCRRFSYCCISFSPRFLSSLQTSNSTIQRK